MSQERNQKQLTLTQIYPVEKDVKVRESMINISSESKGKQKQLKLTQIYHVEKDLGSAMDISLDSPTQHGSSLFGSMSRNPWDILNKDERETITGFLNFMLPVPHMINLQDTTGIFNFVYIKQAQMRSFRAIYRYWSFDQQLIIKLEKIFRDIDINNELLDQQSAKIITSLRHNNNNNTNNNNNNNNNDSASIEY